MSNRYFSGILTTKHQEAAIFSDPYTWKILDYLRQTGAKGLTANEIHRKLEQDMRVSVSESKVYGLLRRLYMEDWVNRYYDKNAGAQRGEQRGAQRVISAFHWGIMTTHDRKIIYKEFEDVVKNKEMDHIRNRLFPVMLEFIDKVLHDLGEDPDTQRFLPQPGGHCIDCHVSHEAIEFFTCLLYIAVDRFLDEDSKVFDEYMRKNDFAGEPPEEGYR